MTNAALPLTPLCSICRKPVELENCKTDHNGYAVHEDCYTSQVSQAKPPATRISEPRP